MARPVERRRSVVRNEDGAVGPQARRSGLTEPRSGHRDPSLPRARGRRHRWQSSSSTRPGSRRRAPRPRRAVSSSLTSRKLRPSIASATAFTPPPKRVAIPPASTTIATVPAFNLSTPADRASAKPRSPGSGSGSRSDGSGGSTRPWTTLPGRRQRAVNEPAAELLELRGVEAVCLERRPRRGIDLVENQGELTASPPDLAATPRTAPGGFPPRSRSRRSAPPV